MCESLEDQHTNEKGSATEPSSARELALEEILREVDEIERKVFAWSGSAFLNNELEGAEDADCKTELYSELCGIGNTMHWLRTKICSLSSPNHADAGKVEGPTAAVAEMQTSAGADYYVCVKVGDREITPHMFKERWKAEYEVAEWLWLFNGGDKPDLLAYGPLPSAPSQEVAG